LGERAWFLGLGCWEAFEVALEAWVVKGDDIVLEEAVHAKQAGDGEIVLEGRVDLDLAAWQVERYAVYPGVRGAADSLRPFPMAREQVKSEE